MHLLHLFFCYIPFIFILWGLTPLIYAVPSVEMMRKAMESGKMSIDEKPLWPDDEAEMARICGLR